MAPPRPDFQGQTARFRYTSDTVFDTFPWPQKPSAKQIRAVADAAGELRALRRQIMDANDWSLRDLYRTLETPGDNKLRDAHATLDTAVRAAYGMKEKEDILAFLLTLNLELAAKEAKGESIHSAWFARVYYEARRIQQHGLRNGLKLSSSHLLKRLQVFC